MFMFKRKTSKQLPLRNQVYDFQHNVFPFHQKTMRNNNETSNICGWEGGHYLAIFCN